MRNIVLAITGASGAAYARALAEQLLAAGCRLHLLVSPDGRKLLDAEIGPGWDARLVTEDGGRVVEHGYDNLADALSSGSVPTDGMVICPASANTVASVAAGLADNLIDRAAHVHLKERRRLIVVPREMPMDAIMLENLARLARAGAIVAPACPGFYFGPQGVDDLVNFVVARVLDLLGVSHELVGRYKDL